MGGRERCPFRPSRQVAPKLAFSWRSPGDATRGTSSFCGAGRCRRWLVSSYCKCISFQGLLLVWGLVFLWAGPHIWKRRRSSLLRTVLFVHLAGICSVLCNLKKKKETQPNKRLSLCSQNDLSPPEPAPQSRFRARPPRSQRRPFPRVAPPAGRDPPTRRRSPRRW